MIQLEPCSRVKILFNSEPKTCNSLLISENHWGIKRAWDLDLEWEWNGNGCGNENGMGSGMGKLLTPDLITF